MIYCSSEYINLNISHLIKSSDISIREVIRKQFTRLQIILTVRQFNFDLLP